MTSWAAETAAQWWADRLMAGDKKEFVKSLIPLIDADLSEHGRCYLNCDYDPHDHLLTAVRAAGLECRGCMFSAKGILPTKHSLWVFPDYLQPREGYGNWRPKIMRTT